MSRGASRRPVGPGQHFLRGPIVFSVLVFCHASFYPL